MIVPGPLLIKAFLFVRKTVFWSNT